MPDREKLAIPFKILNTDIWGVRLSGEGLVDFWTTCVTKEIAQAECDRINKFLGAWLDSEVKKAVDAAVHDVNRTHAGALDAVNIRIKRAVDAEQKRCARIALAWNSSNPVAREICDAIRSTPRQERCKHDVWLGDHCYSCESEKTRWEKGEA